MITDKIITLDKLADICKNEKEKGKKIVNCHGCFDLLHPGHILHFKAAKKYGDILIVTVTPDKFVKKGPGRPIFNEQLRMESIASLAVVDYVALNKWDTAINSLKLLKPDFYVKGKDYSDRSGDITGNILLEEKAVNEGPEREEFFIEHRCIFSLKSLSLLIRQAGFVAKETERVREPSGKYSLRALLS